VRIRWLTLKKIPEQRTWLILLQRTNQDVEDLLRTYSFHLFTSTYSSWIFSAVSGNCTTATVTHWAREMSAFIKSIDRHHLVALGDEGFFNDPSSSLYPYQCVCPFPPFYRQLNDYFLRGTEGVDFAVNIKIETLDFGTFHVCHGLLSFQSNIGANSWTRTLVIPRSWFIIDTTPSHWLGIRKAGFKKMTPLGSETNGSLTMLRRWNRTENQWYWESSASLTSSRQPTHLGFQWSSTPGWRGTSYGKIAFTKTIPNSIILQAIGL